MFKKVYTYLLAFFIIFLLFILNIYADSQKTNKITEMKFTNESLEENYSENITKREFCIKSLNLIEAWYGNILESETVKSIFSEHKIDLKNLNSKSEEEKSILICLGLGIIDKIDNLDSPIKRQDAAIMFYNLLDKMTPVISEEYLRDKFTIYQLPHVFEDSKYIKKEARDKITLMYRYGVMNQTKDNKFEPDNFITKKDADISFSRLYNAYGNLEENPKPELDVYIDRKTLSKTSLNSYYVDFGIGEYYASYFDAEGNTYTAKEKGYYNPNFSEYQIQIVSIGPGISSQKFLNRNGEDIFNDWGMEIRTIFGDIVEILYNPSRMDSKLEDGEEYNYSFIGDLKTGEILYKNARIFSDFSDEPDLAVIELKNNKEGYIDKSGNMVIQPVYKIAGFFDDKNAIVETEKEEFLIIDKNENIIKNLNLQPILDKYEDFSFYGTNIILSNDDDLIFYDALSEKYTDFKENSENILKYEELYNIYITDNSNSPISKKAKELDGHIFYNNINNNLFFLEKGELVEDSSKGYNYYNNYIKYILDKDGNIIYEDKFTERDLIKDNEYGLFMYKSQKDNMVVVMDYYGDIISKIYFDDSTEIWDYNFNNGILVFCIKDNSSEDYSLIYRYFLPDGREIFQNLG